MKCDNCNVNVSSEFAFAIRANQCPACGKTIMQAERMAAFLGLQSLLVGKLGQSDAESIAGLIVANFDIKQRFKEEPKAVEPKEEPKQVVTNSVTEDVTEDSVETNSSEDKAFKDKQLKEARAILQKMKQEALEGGDDDENAREEAFAQAVAERLGDANGLLSTEDESPLVGAIRSKLDFQREQTRKNVLDGSRGTFRRST